MVQGRVCDHINHFGYHIREMGLWKARVAAMLKEPGENTDMYMWHCCMLMHGHAWTTLSCQSHDMLNLCVPESQGQGLGIRLISLLHVNSRLLAPNPSKMRICGKRPLNDESTTAVNHSQLNDNKENQPANHQSTKTGIGSMVCTCKHDIFCELNFLFQLQRKKEMLPNVLLVFVRTAVNVASA